ncbi:ABC transporter substrate-binding protein, partial [Streptomyces millisiae]
MGREVHIEVVDGGAPPSAVAAEVRRLIDGGHVDAVSGWHISSVRHALAPVVAGRVPYSYPALYEGGERRRGIYCCGETPDQQIAPALRWMRDNLGIRKWFVVGDDYVWPRTSLSEVRRYVQ